MERVSDPMVKESPKAGVGEENLLVAPRGGIASKCRIQIEKEPPLKLGKIGEKGLRRLGGTG